MNFNPFTSLELEAHETWAQSSLFMSGRNVDMWGACICMLEIHVKPYCRCCLSDPAHSYSACVNAPPLWNSYSYVRERLTGSIRRLLPCSLRTSRKIKKMILILMTAPWSYHTTPMAAIYSTCNLITGLAFQQPFFSSSSFLDYKRGGRRRAIMLAVQCTKFRSHIVNPNIKIRVL